MAVSSNLPRSRLLPIKMKKRNVTEIVEYIYPECPEFWIRCRETHQQGWNSPEQSLYFKR